MNPVTESGRSGAVAGGGGARAGPPAGGFSRPAAARGPGAGPGQGLDDEEIRRYVFTAVAHHASKEARRRRRRPTAALENPDLVIGPESSPEEHVTQREHSRITRDLLSSLPPRRRAVLMLRYGLGLDPAQICATVKGLSPRAYRKEITRGIEELTTKLRVLERGEWCADREPVLKAYAAGLADAEQRQQARQHLSHCRHCTEFVGRLSGHLHDLGSGLAVPGALDAVDGGRLTLPDRIGDFAGKAREAVESAFHRGDGAVASESTGTLTAAGGARGAGTAGAGLAAKLVGLGAGGKAALACLSGGVAVTACVAAGVGPVSLPASTPDRVERPHATASAERGRIVSGPADMLPSQLGNEEPPASEPAPAPPPTPPPAPPPPPAEPEPPATETTVPAVPEDVPDFGLAPTTAQAPPAPQEGATRQTSHGAAVAAEFGP
jgi:RNA polymerase sigma factor (sigma-70 family)